MRGGEAAALSAILAFGLGAVPSAAQLSPRAAGAATPVLLDVSVTDADGRPVNGLTAADFEVTEDGRPIDALTVTPFAIPDSAPEGRDYLIGVDALHLTPRGAARVRPLIDQFVTQCLGPHDRAAILSIGQTSSASPLTADRQLLLRASGVASTVALQASAGRRNAGLTFGAPGDMQHAGARALAVLTSTIAGTATRGRRTAILLVSEGIPLDGPNSREIIDAEHVFFAAASRANVVVYPIDPVGMSGVASGIAPSEESEPAGLSELDSLRAIADETGGRLVVTTDLGPAFRQIVQDSTSYYVISYVSPQPAKAPGTFHKVRVRTKNHRLTVTARKGWYESR